jgi:hypothetical protein
MIHDSEVFRSRRTEENEDKDLVGLRSELEQILQGAA